ncbi:MAG: hypothetical protein KGI33_11400 [Thaumarchaeota archaeon]|nr:hypothetical protein [Nitrososphaerota archaeon]
MNKKDAEQIAKSIGAISSYVRFAGVINSRGGLVAYVRRSGMRPLLNQRKTRNQFSHLAVQSGMVARFNRQLGKVKFLWEEREKAQTISFGLGRNTVWVSIDKNVVRSEVLRIIDGCLPIVKRYK